MHVKKSQSDNNAKDMKDGTKGKKNENKDDRTPEIPSERLIGCLTNDSCSKINTYKLILGPC